MHRMPVFVYMVFVQAFCLSLLRIFDYGMLSFQGVLRLCMSLILWPDVYSRLAVLDTFSRRRRKMPLCCGGSHPRL